jgi:hypothetical protein
MYIKYFLSSMKKQTLHTGVYQHPATRVGNSLLNYCDLAFYLSVTIKPTLSFAAHKNWVPISNATEMTHNVNPTASNILEQMIYI